MTALPTTEQAIQRLVDRAAAHRHVHSLLVAVETDDRTISTRMAGGDAGPDDAYYIASITKMFTATVIVQLVDEGRLRLDDQVVGLLPNQNLTGVHRHRGIDHTDRLEVHHLLHQTSGLPDYFTGGLEQDLKAGRDRSYSIEDIIDIARTTAAEFPPGDRDNQRSAYSDTNYQLLTAIIEATTATTFAQAVNDRIAEPLNLTSTYLAGDRRQPHKATPLPLHHKDRQLSLPKALASEKGAGGIVSTLDDQIRFQRAYHAGRLFDPSHLSSMRAWNRLFFPIDYGYGLMRYRLPRWMTGFRPAAELIGHSGSTGSFAFYASVNECHIVGTFNQLHKPSRPFRLMTKLADAVRRTPTSA